MSVGKKQHGRAKKKTGRPLRKFTDDQINEMQDYALIGCQNNTIATLMDIPIVTLERRFGKLLTKKRCERKYNLRVQQNKAAENGVPAILIFLGKNELDQKDKHEVGGTDGNPIQVAIVDFKDIKTDDSAKQAISE